VGRISLTELLKRGYSKDVAIGSLAGAGTLGFLIPPSNIMIIYGVLADVSIAKLFTAGFIPGFLLAGCFMAWIMIHTTIRSPSLCRRRAQACASVPCEPEFADARSVSWDPPCS
jgi:TRAP-type C4-dicarboxylate transport system permease large subunit